MGRGYVFVEGHGEKQALLSLLHRLSADLGLPTRVWAEPIRSTRLTTEAGISIECERLRSKHDCEVALFFRDDEDGCLKIDAPKMAVWLHAQALPHPVAVVLAFREYETFFLAGAESLAGRPLVDDGGLSRPGLVAGARFEGNPEARRDAKGWLAAHFLEERATNPLSINCR